MAQKHLCSNSRLKKASASNQGARSKQGWADPKESKATVDLGMRHGNAMKFIL